MDTLVSRKLWASWVSTLAYFKLIVQEDIHEKWS